MKQIIINGKEILLIEVPEDGELFELKEGYVEFETVNDSDAGTYDCIDLPPGKWKLIGKGNEISEDDWKGIVQGYGKMYMDYTSKLNGLAAHSLTLEQSGCSLIASHSMKPETTLILEKVL